MSAEIRAGDKDLHGPTGETWIVAAVHGDELAWCGWPPGVARTSDCTLVERCEDEKHVEIARHEWPVGDYRRSMAARHSCEACTLAAPGGGR